jgi:ubiquinone/menaquinone biosynthesis C-methylase UbiE
VTEQVHHPIFARLYERIASTADRRGADEHRRKLLYGLAGRIIEVGAGNGANFPYYSTSVEQVVAVEPEEYLRQRAEQAAALPAARIRVVSGLADELPGEDGSFDAGVVALVLCTVPDQERALAELFRVIKAGGELRFYEHVIAQKRLGVGLQRLADATFWPKVFGGCHPTRETAEAIEQAGFVVESCERFTFSPGPLIPLPYILGVARRPRASNI